MKKHSKMVIQGISIFLLSFLFLWILFGAIRLHEFNEELKTHIEESERKMEEAWQKIEIPGSIEQEEEIIIKVVYVKYSYLTFLEKKILEEKGITAWSFIDVYSRQRVLWWGHYSLLNADFLIDQWEDYFSDDCENRQKIEDYIDEKREETQCFPQYNPPLNFLNRRAFENTEPLWSLLERLCKDYEKENDLLYRAYQTEAAYYLSKYIQGFSRMKWYEKPIYGVFPRKTFVTFRYIWLDISVIICISFFTSIFAVWWKRKKQIRNIHDDV